MPTSTHGGPTLPDSASQVFLSYSRNDLAAANALRHALVQAGLAVFKDDASLRCGDRWLGRLQDAVSDCGAFVVLVGRDGVRRWVGAEVDVAITRHLDAHDDALRLPIFPVLLPEAALDPLPRFLSLFQATRWDGGPDLPADLLDAVKARRLRFDAGPPVEGCPFRGLSTFNRQHTHLFFGRRHEVLAALQGLGDQTGTDPESLTAISKGGYKRWLQIEGNSGSGKSSLVQAGLLPLVEQGALWARTGFERWKIIGPMMPGKRPVKKLAEAMEHTLKPDASKRDSLALGKRLEADEQALASALNDYREPGTAFLLVIDQFEELFTFADEAARRQFDALLACALGDADCPLFVISTVRADFLDRYDQLPRLAERYNEACQRYFLPSISERGLRDIITGPAQLAELDVSEVLTALLDDASDDMAGALPLVGNALRELWASRRGARLSGDDYRVQGGLAGMLAKQADALLTELDADPGLAGKGRAGALELLLRLTRINDGNRHTRQRIRREDALITAGRGNTTIGERILTRLSGMGAEDTPSEAQARLRLITVSTEADGQYVDLIHETLVRARPRDPGTGTETGYWPSLFDYITRNRQRDFHRRQLESQAERWTQSRGLARWTRLASQSDLADFKPIALQPGSREARFIKWSRRAQWAYGGITGLAVLTLSAYSFFRTSERWVDSHNLPREYIWKDMQWRLGLAEEPPPSLKEIPIPSPVTFTMGCLPGRDKSDDLGDSCGHIPFFKDTAHPVSLTRSYALGEFEVTVRQYLFFLRDSGATPSARPECSRSKSPTFEVHISDTGDLDKPMTNVSWCDANAYLEWLNRRFPHTDRTWRLPTEAEWEYAARGPQRGMADTVWWWGNRRRRGDANCGEFSEGPRSVIRTNGSELDPPFGLQDMIGNVAEWVEDRLSSFTSERQTNPVVTGKDASNRVVRGQSWVDLVCGTAVRGVSSSSSKYVGFRACLGSPIDPRDAV